MRRRRAKRLIDGLATDERRTVLYLITNDLSSLFLRGQLTFLQEHGFRVVVGTRLESPEGAAKFDLGVEVQDLPFTREPHPWRDLIALVATIRLIRRVRPDIVNASTPKAGLLGSVAAWLCRVPMRVYVVRGLRFETATGRRRQLFRLTEKLAIRLATTVIFNSKSLRQVAEDEGLIEPGRGVILGGGGNGLDTTRFENLPTRAEARASFGLGEDDLVIGFVGRLTKDKGIADLLAVFATVAAELPAARLLIVGSYEAGDPVGVDARTMIESDSRIVHVEWSANPGIAYRAMDVLCFPSYREGLPNVPIEAQYCGVPVVGYAATGTVDAVLEDGIASLVPLGDQVGLTLRLLRFMEGLHRQGGGQLELSEAIANKYDRRRVFVDLLGSFESAGQGRADQTQPFSI